MRAKALWLLLLHAAVNPAINVHSMSYRELQAACKAAGVPARGKATLLRKRLLSLHGTTPALEAATVEEAVAQRAEAKELIEAQAALALALVNADVGGSSVPTPLLSPGAASSVLDGGVHVEAQFVPPELISELRSELAAKGAAGQFATTSSFSSDGQEDDLRAAMTCKPDLGSAAFSRLYERLDVVREELARRLGRELARGMEATYVVYPHGGYYRRHVDSLAGVDVGGSGSRSVSFICYLNEPGWTEHDGGQLRIYSHGGRFGLSESAHVDVLPECGSLVLFDSKLVSHEVLPTRRERACLVGWMRES